MARDRHKIKFQISDTIINTVSKIAQYQDLPEQTVMVNAWRVGLIWLTVDHFINEPIALVEATEDSHKVLLTVPEVHYQRAFAIAKSLNLGPAEVNRICLSRGIEVLRRITAIEQKISELS